MIKDGTVWQSSDKKFVVLHTIEIEGQVWVHYRDQNLKNPVAEPNEYSCYLESFLSRFTPLSG